MIFFGGTYYFYLQGQRVTQVSSKKQPFLLAWFTLRTWRCRQYIVPKRRKVPQDCMGSHPTLYKPLPNMSYPFYRHATVRKTKNGTEAFIFARMDTYWKIKQTGENFAYESNRVSGRGNPSRAHILWPATPKVLPHHPFG